jgi:hypothetical protein
VRSIDDLVQAIDAEIVARQASDDKTTETEHKNRQFVYTKSAQLSELADMAKDGAHQLRTAKARTLAAIAAAKAAGFIVHEDLAVTDRDSSAARATEANVHAQEIQAAAIDLMTLDEQIALRLTTAANRLRDS